MRRRKDLADEASPTDRAARALPAGLVERAAALRAGAGFRPALAGYCRGMADAALVQWPVYKLFDQLHRYVVCYMLIHNYYAWRHAGGPPPTLSALQKVAGSSARQTAGFVAALKAGRFVTAEADPDDRRATLLRPAPAMIAEIGRSMRLFVAAADAAEPGRPSVAPPLADPDRLGDVVHRSAAYVLANGTLIHDFPRVLQFAGRDCGYPLLAAVVGARYAEDVAGAPEAVPLSLRALAQRFQVSPAHIGNLLGEAERQGWFAIGEGGRLGHLSDDLLDEFETWASWQMAHLEAIAGETAAFFASRTPARMDAAGA